MNNMIRRFCRSIFAVLFVCAAFSFTSCDEIEEVQLDAGLQSISVTKMPNKIKYSREDVVLDTTGIEVTAHYRSGYSKLLPLEELTFTGFRSTEGYYTSSEAITVTYDNHQGTIRQTTFQITYTDLYGLSVTSQPEKTRYTQNYPLSFAGLIVNAQYQDSSIQPIFSEAILEALYITKFGDAEESILSEEEYQKIKSYTGRDEYGNAVSLTIPLDYKIDENKNFVRDEVGERILKSKIEFIGFDDSFIGVTEGQQQVIIKYTEISGDSFAIEREASFNVKLASIANLSLPTAPNKLHYSSNAALSFDGMVLKAVYTDGASEVLFTKNIYDNLDTLTEDDRAKIENYTGGSSLSIPLAWKKDTNGDYVYKNGKLCAAREIEFMDFNSKVSASSQTVRVRYKDNQGSTEQVIETSFNAIFEKMSGITIASEPAKRKYKRGEAFDFSGIQIRAQYSNYVTEDIFNNEIYSKLTTLTAEDRLAIEAYTGIDGKPLTIPLEWKRDENGDIVLDSEDKNVPLKELVFTGFDSSKITSNQEVTVTLNDYSVTPTGHYPAKFAVGYSDIASIMMGTTPTKLKYFHNEPLDLSGMVINAQYLDNSIEEIFSNDIYKHLPVFNTQDAAIKSYTGETAYGVQWFEQLEPREKVPANSLTIPLAWKKNENGEYVNKFDKVIDFYDDNKVCVTGLVIIGFNSSETSGSQNVRVRYIDNSGAGIFEKEVSFTVSYKILDRILVSSLPKSAVVGCEKNAPIDFTGITIEAYYRDGSYEVIFSDKILKNLPSGYAPSVLGNDYGTDPLNIILQKSGSNKTLRSISFKGYNSTVISNPQTVIVNYTEGEDKADGTISVQTQYQLKYDGLRSLSVTQAPALNYVMNADSTSKIVGGIGRKGVNRSGANDTLSNIVDWHFNVDGLKLVVNYNDGSQKELSFVNRDSSDCYGTGANEYTAAYYSEKNKFKYMQRWAEEKKDGERYKIRIDGFDPAAAFVSSGSFENTQQTITLSYTEDGVTVSTQMNITYSFRKVAEDTTSLINVGFDEYKLGDFPQSYNGDERILVNTMAKQQKGLLTYYLGSDGYYYCKRTLDGEEKFYKVEPIVWESLGDGYYRSKKTLYIGIPYYSGKIDRTNKKSKEFKTYVNKRWSYGTVNYTYDIGCGSFMYSTLRNWLNGDNINGDSTYNGRGFLQTAFSDEVQTGLLKNIGITEYFNAMVTTTSNKVDEKNANTITGTIAASGSDYTIDEITSVKVMISPAFTEQKVARNFFNFTEDSYEADQRINHPISKSWEKFYYNDANDLKIVDYPKNTDFAGYTDSIWVAADVRTNPANNYATCYYRNDKTYEQSTPDYTRRGIVPIIKVGD